MHDVLIGLVDGDDERWLSLSCRPLPATSGAAAGTVCSFADVTKVIHAQQELSYRATHDELTGLCNRMVFVDSLQHALARGRRMQSNTAVLFIDLDRFKLVNDTLGHASGDEVLTEIAKRLQGATRSMDRVGRIAGDEFIVMCNDVTGIEPVAQRGGRARASDLRADPTSRTAASPHCTRASVSRSRPAATATPKSCCATRTSPCAGPRSSAAPRSRSSTTTCACRPSAAVSSSSAAGRDRERPDRRALPADRRRSRTPRILGVEALARFNHPELGSIPPDRVHPRRRGDRPHPLARHRGARQGVHAGRVRGAPTTPPPPTSTCR